MLILTLLSLLFFPLGALFLSFIGIPLTKNKYSRIIYCLIIATVMSLIAFFYEPSQSYDLFRIFERANWMKESNLTRIIEIFGSGLEIGFNLSIFIIIKLFSKHSISAIFTFIGMFLACYVISDYSLRKNISRMQTFLTFVIFFLSFQHMYLISGIRNFVSFIFIFFLIYIEKIQKKESLITHLLYLVPLLFHSSMIVFLFFRILLQFKNKIIDKMVYIISIAALVAPPILLFVLSFFKSNAIILTIYNKLNSYLSYDTSHFYTFMILLALFIQLAVYIYIYFKVKKGNINDNLKLNESFYTYLKWMLLLGFGVIRYGVLLDRVLVLLSCLTIVLIIDYFKHLSNFKRENRFLCICIPLAMSLLLFRNQFHNYHTEIDDSINMVAKVNILNFEEMSENYD